MIRGAGLAVKLLLCVFEPIWRQQEVMLCHKGVTFCLVDT
jgi:hypothetical protein